MGRAAISSLLAAAAGDAGQLRVRGRAACPCFGRRFCSKEQLIFTKDLNRCSRVIRPFYTRHVRIFGPGALSCSCEFLRPGGGACGSGILFLAQQFPGRGGKGKGKTRSALLGLVQDTSHELALVGQNHAYRAKWRVCASLAGFAAAKLGTWLPGPKGIFIVWAPGRPLD